MCDEKIRIKAHRKCSNPDCSFINSGISNSSSSTTTTVVVVVKVVATKLIAVAAAEGVAVRKKTSNYIYFINKIINFVHQ